MSWSTWVVTTRTGVKRRLVKPAGGQWRCVLNGVGDGNFEFMLRSPDSNVPVGSARDLFQPWSRIIVQCWNDVPVYAGYVVGSSWDRVAGRLTVRTRDFRAILAKRFAWTVENFPRTPSAGGWQFAITGRSMRGAMVDVLSRTTIGTPGDQWHLRLGLPAAEAGSFAISWDAWNHTSAEAMLAQIQDMTNGPDLAFTSQWTADGLFEWVALIGSPTLSNGVLLRHLSAEIGKVSSLSSEQEAVDQFTGVFGAGEGSGKSTKMGFAGNQAGSDIPNMDVKRPLKNATTTAAAQSLATAELRASREPVDQSTRNAFATDVFGSVGLGGTVREYSVGDEWDLDGWRDRYVIGISGSVGSELLVLEVQ